jgi:hypothetical protein
MPPSTDSVSCTLLHVFRFPISDHLLAAATT